MNQWSLSHLLNIKLFSVVLWFVLCSKIWWIHDCFLIAIRTMLFRWFFTFFSKLFFLSLWLAFNIKHSSIRRELFFSLWTWIFFFNTGSFSLAHESIWFSTSFRNKSDNQSAWVCSNKICFYIIMLKSLTCRNLIRFVITDREVRDSFAFSPISACRMMINMRTSCCKLSFWICRIK